MPDIGSSSFSETDASNNSTSPNGAPEGMAPSGVNDTIRAHWGATKRFWNRINPTATSAGSSTVYTLTYSVAPSALVGGELYTFVLDETCGSAPTLNINSLGAKNLRKLVAGTWANLSAGDVVANEVLCVRYNSGDDKFDVVFRSGLPGLTDAATFTNKTINVADNTIYAAMVPQGRLTLSTGVPVQTANVTGATSIYYAPYCGNLVPIYDGTGLKWTVFTELTNTTTDNTKNPAAVTTNSNYDLFVWNDSGTIRLGRGPAWTSDTGRGTGAGTTELERVNGVLLNKVAITNGPVANRGTYVGTVRTDGSSQCNWHAGAVGANGTAALLNVWNAYNRVAVRGLIGDSTDSWVYSTATVRSANNSTTMRVSFVQGLQEDYFSAEYAARQLNDTSASGGVAGVGLNSTSAFSGRFLSVSNQTGSGSGILLAVGRHEARVLGFNYMQALEYGGGSGTNTWYGDGGAATVIQAGLTYDGRF